MKIKISILLLLFSFIAFGQTNTPRFIPVWFMDIFESSELNKTYELGAYLKPLFLEADFNGDQKEDIATTLINSENGKLGLLIIFKDFENCYVIGAGHDFGSGGDDFEWADTWEVFEEETTYETKFLDNGDVDGIKEIKLKHAAISIREDEGSGGLIYFNGEEFILIHQGD